MAGAKFEYDEKGTTFYYFVLCFFALLLLPITYFTWIVGAGDKDKNKDLTKVCRCPHCCEKRANKLKKKPKTTFVRVASQIVVLVLWLALLYGVYRVSQFERDFVEYDPFAVLEIDKGASAAEIKRQYRKLSLVYHPDKDTGDERKFMRIAKAYEALTNEESRKNWEEHGNPDGPQATTFGIALPSWIVSEENSFLVLGAYVFAFMVVLPVVVGTWWYKSIKYGCDQVLMDTTRIYFFFFRKTPCMQVKRIIMVFSASMEFEKSCNPEVQERRSDNDEIPQLLHELQTVNENCKEEPFGCPFSVKCRALILAHMERVSIPKDTLEKDLHLILRKTPLLVQEMINIITQHYYFARADNSWKAPRLETVDNVMKFSQIMVQALRENKSPLLQLPHILPEHLRFFNTKKRNIRSIKQLLEMKRSFRRDMFRFLSDEQYDDVMLVAGMIPYMELNVTPQVMDDEDEGMITAGAVVTVTVELNRKTLKDVCSEKDEDDYEHIEAVEPTTVDGEIPPEAKNATKANKVWQKTKRKGKKSKPVKQQAKKKPTKQALKSKEDAEIKGEEQADGNEENETEKGKKDSKKSRKNVENDAENAEEEELSDSEENSDSENASVVDSEDNEDGKRIDDDDDEWHRMQEGVDKIEKVLDHKSRSSHDVHAPYFPDDKQEWWWVYICDRKKQEMITTPTQVVSLKDTESVKLQYQAPTKCGHYTYTVVVRSDSYLDVDVMKNFKFEVHEAKEVVTKQWDFESDEDEDKDEESGESEWDEEEEDSD